VAYHLSDLGVAAACPAHSLAISIIDLAALFVDRHGEGKYRRGFRVVGIGLAAAPTCSELSPAIRWPV
jgi:hypothetical protein